MYDEPLGDIRGDEVEIVVPSVPRRKPKPIVCHTGASTELYANPRNCRCPPPNSNQQIDFGVKMKTVLKLLIFIKIREATKYYYAEFFR